MTKLQDLMYFRPSGSNINSIQMFLEPNFAITDDGQFQVLPVTVVEHPVFFQINDIKHESPESPSLAAARASNAAATDSTKPMFTVDLALSQKSNYHERFVYSLLAFSSDVGGFLGALTSIFGYFASLYTPEFLK